MSQQFPTLDAAQSVFFSRQLEQIETKMYEVKYPDLEAELLLPNRVQVDPGNTKYTWRLFDKRGLAVPMAGHEDGAPTTDVNGSEQSSTMMSWISGYQYNIEEIDAASKAGVPLDQMRALATRRTLAEALNLMALMGNSAKGIEGLFSLTNTLTYSTPNGAATTPQWSTKTADEILTDMFGMVDGIPNNTIDTEGGSTRAMNFLLPKSLLRFIGTKRLTTTVSDTTVLEFFSRQRPNVKVMGANYLDTAGGSSSKRGVVYDPTELSWLVSIPFEQLPVQPDGFRFKINARARAGGVISPYPKSVIYGDNL